MYTYLYIYYNLQGLGIMMLACCLALMALRVTRCRAAMSPRSAPASSFAQSCKHYRNQVSLCMSTATLNWPMSVLHLLLATPFSHVRVEAMDTGEVDESNLVRNRQTHTWTTWRETECSEHEAARSTRAKLNARAPCDHSWKAAGWASRPAWCTTSASHSWPRNQHSWTAIQAGMNRIQSVPATSRNCVCCTEIATSALLTYCMQLSRNALTATAHALCYSGCSQSLDHDGSRFAPCCCPLGRPPSPRCAGPQFQLI